MEPVEKDYILAGADQVAIDAISAKMMGFDPMSLPYIRLAVEKGLGVGDPRQIEVRGVDIEEINFRFSVGDNLASRVGDFLWFSPLKALQNMFFRTPLVNLFIFGSFFYHDYYWWPFKGRRKMEVFRKNHRWGQLFDKYREEVE